MDIPRTLPHLGFTTGESVADLVQAQMIVCRNRCKPIDRLLHRCTEDFEGQLIPALLATEAEGPGLAASLLEGNSETTLQRPIQWQASAYRSLSRFDLERATKRALRKTDEKERAKTLLVIYRGLIRADQASAVDFAVNTLNPFMQECQDPALCTELIVACLNEMQLIHPDGAVQLLKNGFFTHFKYYRFRQGYLPYTLYCTLFEMILRGSDVLGFDWVEMIINQLCPTPIGSEKQTMPLIPQIPFTKAVQALNKNDPFFDEKVCALSQIVNAASEKSLDEKPNIFMDSRWPPAPYKLLNRAQAEKILKEHLRTIDNANESCPEMDPEQSQEVPQELDLLDLQSFVNGKDINEIQTHHRAVYCRLKQILEDFNVFTSNSNAATLPNEANFALKAMEFYRNLFLHFRHPNIDDLWDNVETFPTLPAIANAEDATFEPPANTHTRTGDLPDRFKYLLRTVSSRPAISDLDIAIREVWDILFSFMRTFGEYFPKNYFKYWYEDDQYFRFRQSSTIKETGLQYTPSAFIMAGNFPLEYRQIWYAFLNEKYAKSLITRCPYFADPLDPLDSLSDAEAVDFYQRLEEMRLHMYQNEITPLEEEFCLSIKHHLIGRFLDRYGVQQM